MHPVFAPVPTIIWTIPTLPPTLPASVPPLDPNPTVTVSDIELMHYYSLIRFSPIAPRLRHLDTSRSTRSIQAPLPPTRSPGASSSIQRPQLPRNSSRRRHPRHATFLRSDTPLQPVLNDIRSDNAVAAFLLASLMVPISWAMPVVQRASQGIKPPMQPSEVMQHLFDILQLQKGMSHISVTGWPYLQKPLAPLFNLKTNPPDTIFPDEDEALLHHLETRVLSSIESEDRRPIYYEALQKFRQFYPLPDCPNPKALIHTWPTKVSPEFLKEMTKRKPAAILLLAYHGAMLHGIPDCFWLGDAGRMLVLAVDELLPPGFEDVMSWPKATVGVDPLIL
ncbi:hypothetical protein DL98DRAFT_532677 [Cadophora sp. DSE1049]|nr:hypothetical protein DL98DRAFT_532677 [Cadophora sp. DSE1049]